jgi:hypothetical protein
MRKSKLPLKKLYAFVSHFLKGVCPNKQAKKKGRPQKYEDALIITLGLLKSILEECSKLLLEDKQTLCYITDATGSGFGDKYKLNWERGR